MAILDDDKILQQAQDPQQPPDGSIMGGGIQNTPASKAILDSTPHPLTNIPGSKLHEAGKMAYAQLIPKITADPGTTDYFRQRQEQLEFEKDHPNGSPISKHPGTFGTILHGLAKAGNIAGDIMAPGVMADIPGTDLNKQRQENQNLAGIKSSQETENQGKEASAAVTRAGADKDNADTAAAKAKEPAPKEEKWSNFDKYTDTDGTPLLHEDNSGQVVRADNRQPPKGFKLVTPDKPRQTREVTRVENGVPHSVMVDAETGDDVKDEGQTKIPHDTSGKADARSDKSYQYNQGRLDKIRQPIDQLSQRMGRLTDTLNQHNPQADALVAPELMTVMAGGMGSGLRMNEAEISRIVGGRSAWENLKASMQHWATNPSDARSITPDQDKMIRALIGEVGSKLQKKQAILESAQENLLGSDDPKEHRTIMAQAQQALDSIDAGQQSTERQRPANVPEGYVYKDGPKGKGWYRPNAATK